MYASDKKAREMRKDAYAIFQAALQAVDPVAAILRHVRVEEEHLLIGESRLSLDDYERIKVVGAGKAGAPMAKAMEDLLGDRIANGVVVVKAGHDMPLQRIQLREASHPVPDERGVRGAEEILAIASEAGERDLVVCLISGGASALLVAPAAGLSLADKQAVTQLLLACGATIHEINTVRKHLSSVKGGRLARLAHPATVVSLILSDVVGDDLEVIGSGPTVPDPTTFFDTEQILKGYAVWDKLPVSVRDHIEKGVARSIEESPKPDNPAFQHAILDLVGTNLQALEAASKEAEDQGYHPIILTTKVEGEAREIVKVHTSIAKEILSSSNPLPIPACILCGGEPTVTLKGDGKGGRNQEFALAAAQEIADAKHIVVLSGGSDGTDGPTDAAGAIVDGQTVARAREKSLDPNDYLQRNDAYNFFSSLGDLVITGPTRTNVMDVQILLVDK